MCEQYITKGRALFYSLTAHARQYCNMCDDKCAVLEFPIFPMIVYLYDSSISDTYSFIFSSQSMIVTPYQNAKVIHKMTCSLYPCGLLFVTNIIIASILVLLDFMRSSHSCSSDS